MIYSFFVPYIYLSSGTAPLCLLSPHFSAADEELQIRTCAVLGMVMGAEATIGIAGPSLTETSKDGAPLPCCALSCRLVCVGSTAMSNLAPLYLHAKKKEKKKEKKTKKTKGTTSKKEKKTKTPSKQTGVNEAKNEKERTKKVNAGRIKGTHKEIVP